MKDQFVTYDIAKKLKELGFDEPCIYHWEIDAKNPTPILFSCHCTVNIFTSINSKLSKEWEFAAPLWQQAIDWLRDKHTVDIWIERDYPSMRFFVQCPQLQDSKTYFDHWFDSYEEAREDIILKALELIEIWKTNL